MPPTAQPVALKREVVAVKIDPLSMREIDEVRLPAGTLIEDAHRLIHEATAAEQPTVTVRIQYADGCVGLKRIATATLRAALADDPS
jgi:hypothetical protein